MGLSLQVGVGLIGGKGLLQRLGLLGQSPIEQGPEQPAGVSAAGVVLVAEAGDLQPALLAQLAQVGFELRRIGEGEVRAIRKAIAVDAAEVMPLLDQLGVAGLGKGGPIACGKKDSPLNRVDAEGLFEADHQALRARPRVAVQTTLAFTVRRLLLFVAGLDQTRAQGAEDRFKGNEDGVHLAGLLPCQLQQRASRLLLQLAGRWFGPTAPLQKGPQLPTAFFQGVRAQIEHPMLQQQGSIGLAVALQIGAAGFVQAAVENDPRGLKRTHAARRSRRSRASQAPSPRFLWPCQISGMNEALGQCCWIRANS